MSGVALKALKELDHAAYLACLFVPEDKREAVAALYAYVAELKRIPLLVSEPLPGEIRLQWWRDVIAGDRAGEASNHPVAAAMIAAMGQFRLPVAPLDAMAEARIFDLYNDPMPDIAALETYLGETQAALIQLCCLVLDPSNAGKNAEASGHAGMAIGTAAILMQLRRATLRQRMFIPSSILKSIGCTRDQLFAGDEEACAKAVTALVALGRDHLKTFKRSANNISPTLRQAFLQTSLCEPVFRKAEQLGAKTFVTEFQIGPLLTQLRFTYRAMRGW